MSALALIPADREDGCDRIKKLVLDAVPSPHSKRAYEQALDAFERWHAETGRAAFSKAAVQAWHAALEAAALSVSSINIRLAALKELAAEAADNGLLSQETAAAIARVRRR